MATHELDRKNSEDEKRSPTSEHHEIAGSESIDHSDANGDDALLLVGKERTAEFSEEYNLKLRRKLDLLIPPLCAAVYFTQFMDKTSLNYASIMGLPITGQNYNLVSAAFYFGRHLANIAGFESDVDSLPLGFLVFEFPTVYLSQKTRVAKYLGCNIVLWGIILMLHAVGTSFGAFFALRFLLGMCESCVAPTLILIISMFYKKNEQASRISWFYVMNGLTQVFGGFIAYGVSFSDNPNLAPYKIIYILLGGLAIVSGDSGPCLDARLTEERIAALERVRNDQGGVSNRKIKKSQIIEAFTDIRSWLIVLSTILISNIIIKSFGYTTRQTLILSTPAGLVAAAMTIFCGWYSDKKNSRMTPIVIALVPTIAGTALIIGLNGSDKKGALLFGTYLIGTFGSALATIYAYNASNTSGHTKKSTLNAMTLLTFSVGNIIGTEIFQPKDAPGYIPGKVAIMVLLIIQLLLSYVLKWINLRLNKKKVAQIAELKRSKGWTDADVQKERERHAFMDLTDHDLGPKHYSISALGSQSCRYHNLTLKRGSCKITRSAGCVAPILPGNNLILNRILHWD
ncbi:MFS general substrate transporter [Gymnopus androsaceus JB14]|uniref:MFS general substrate transporter n=1 Tax=Gymnopus androsaceus JB14 TaxID=1447944 RepID=A0A6A4IQH4_9AGAR|nr:MFS general substrate transporter [Gymnopus androsaceus JB14]